MKQLWTRFEMETAKKSNLESLWKPEREECPLHGQKRVVLTRVQVGKGKYLEAYCGVCKRLIEQEFECELVELC